MSTIASQITSLTIVYSTIYSGAGQSKLQSSASLAFVWGIHRGPVNSPHKWPVTRKMFPFDDVIMNRPMMRKVFSCHDVLMFFVVWPGLLVGYCMGMFMVAPARLLCGDIHLIQWSLAYWNKRHPLLQNKSTWHDSGIFTGIIWWHEEHYLRRISSKMAQNRAWDPFSKM